MTSRTSKEIAAEASEALHLTVDRYQYDANRTAAPPTQEVLRRMNQRGYDWLELLAEMIMVGRNADSLKKYTFYNKGACPPSRDMIILKVDRPDWERRLDILHAFIGKVTEAGELAEALYEDKADGLLKEEWDLTNILEEAGDDAWYSALMARGIEVPLAVILLRNIAKLKTRFGDKFSETRANERDLEAERKTLEK